MPCVWWRGSVWQNFLQALRFFISLASGFPFFSPLGARAMQGHAMCSLTPVFTARWGRQSQISCVSKVVALGSYT